LEDGGYSSAMSVIDLNKWLQKTVAFTRSRLFSRRQTLIIEDTELPPLITDRVILDRIIVELLHNAGKYSADGSQIVLSVSEAIVPHSEATSGLRLCVTNPATISSEELPKIFSKFYRIPNADPWKQGGTGLGLALVDRLVRQLGGTLSATSEDGLTTFTVLIPNHKDLFEKENLRR
ncbi:MAG: sensor histidine kinase, partial [Oscillatoriales cyanobacterium]